MSDQKSIYYIDIHDNDTEQLRLCNVKRRILEKIVSIWSW
jgi:hypothetical protein